MINRLALLSRLRSDIVLVDVRPTEFGYHTRMATTGRPTCVAREAPADRHTVALPCCIRRTQRTGMRAARQSPQPATHRRPYISRVGSVHRNHRFDS